jgi:hypothetical protein
MNAAAHFAATYAEARTKFLAAADAAGLDVHSRRHPLLGRDGEVLALDLALDGPADAAALLIVSSGCHGVEGHCGSGVQIALLADGGFRDRACKAGVAVLYLHALNPYGHSWSRRNTHENVDLNRNWHREAPPHNAGYDEIAHLLLPATWPPSPQNEAALMGYAARHGLRGLQAAVSGGQYAHPQGLCYGGLDPSWSQQTLRHVLQEHASRCARLGWIDLHSGLGPAGHGERILACREDAVTLARARAWWGDAVTSLDDGSSSSAPVAGQMWLAAEEECAQAEHTGIALEFGTVPLAETFAALRAEQWHENHPEAPAGDRAAARRRMREAFYLDTDDWKRSVVALLAVAGLAAGGG